MQVSSANWTSWVVDLSAPVGRAVFGYRQDPRQLERVSVDDEGGAQPGCP